MISVITFKYRARSGTRAEQKNAFTAEHVHRFFSGVDRAFPLPHENICVTDDPTGIDERIRTVPIDEKWLNLKNPTWPDRGPNCFPRLMLFGKDFQDKYLRTERFVCCDLDAVFTGRVTPLWTRHESFLIWKTGRETGIPQCGSMFMARRGHFPGLHDEFDPVRSPKLTAAAGLRGSDQAWITYFVGKDVAGWTAERDGIYEYRKLIPRRPWDGRGRRVVANIPKQYAQRAYGSPNAGPLPQNACVVMFTGRPNPWDPEVAVMSPWINEHFTLPPLVYGPQTVPGTRESPEPGAPDLGALQLTTG